MAFTRDDRRIIFFTGGLLVLAALFFMSVLVFATGGSKSPKNTGPLYIGETSDLREKLDLGSPLYFPNPFGGTGFWLDREGGEFVALDIRVPNRTDCNVKWVGRSTNAYVACDDARLQTEELARYPVEVGRRGERKRSVFVDLKHLEPPPTQSSASG